MGSGRLSQPTSYHDAGTNLVTALEGYSSWQVLKQMMMTLIQEFDGTDREDTIPWVDHIKAIAIKTGFDPLEVGMSKLKGTVLCNVNTISKEGNLLWFQFHQLLIEHYSNIPYTSDALNAYAHLMQGENKMVVNTWWGSKYSWNVFITLLNCVTSQEVAGTTCTLFEDCIHHTFDDGLHLSRTPGGQWNMSSRSSVMSLGPKNGTGHFSNLYLNQHSQFYK